MGEAPGALALTQQQREQIQTLWATAVEPIPAPAAETTAQALAFGVNFRIHLGEALRAAWETASAIIKGTAAAHAPFAWWAWAEVGVEALGAVHAIFSSLVQRMRPIDYITAVILAAHPDGLTGPELQQAVEDFLKDANASQFAWHLGMNADRVRRAKEVLASPDWFPDTLKELRKDKFLVEAGDTLKYQSRNYEVGWKAE